MQTNKHILHTRIHTHVCKQTYAHICVHVMYAHVYLHTCIHAWIHIPSSITTPYPFSSHFRLVGLFTRMYIYMYVHTYTYMYVNMYIHTYTCILTYIYIYIHAQILPNHSLSYQLSAYTHYIQTYKHINNTCIRTLHAHMHICIHACIHGNVYLSPPPTPSYSVGIRDCLLAQDSTTGRLACQSAPKLASGAASLDTTAPALGLLAQSASFLDVLKSFLTATSVRGNQQLG